MTAEEILVRFDSEYFQGTDYGEYAFTYDTVIKAMEKYAEEVLKIAAEKAKVTGERGEEYHYHFCTEDDVISVDKLSILNCLK